MAQTLQEVLNTTLSPDNMEKYTPDELADFLVKNEIVKTVSDVNRLVIEGIQNALKNDDEFPIRYYSKDEPMSEDGKIPKNRECLTDEYIKNHMTH